MKKFLFIYLFLILIPLKAQSKLVFTSIDYQNDDVRAAICESDGSNRLELGFNKTYLPVWFNNKIILNSDTFIWECDTAGSNLTRLFPGYRVTPSHNQEKFAFYNEDGIGIADVNRKLIKQISVDALNDAAITWSKNDDKVSFFGSEKMKCYLFNLLNDSLETFGDSILHPLWNSSNDYVLYNHALTTDSFEVVLQLDGINDSKKVISKKDENAVVPIWSNDGNKIAYLSFKSAVEYSQFTDMYSCNLIIYELGKDTSQVISENASFTDKAFPQMCFDEKDEFIYFTKINKNGIGSIARINLSTLQEEVISKDSNLDERFPLVKTFR